MEKFLVILDILKKNIPFLGKLFKGPMKYIVFQIIGLLIQKVSKTKDITQSHQKVLSDKVLMEALINEMVILDEQVKEGASEAAKLSKPNWLIIESWIIIATALLLIIGLLGILIFVSLHQIIKIIASFFVFSLIMMVRTVINHRFASRNKTTNVIEVILLQTLLKLYSLK